MSFYHNSQVAILRGVLVVHAGAGTWKHVKNFEEIKKVISESLREGSKELLSGNSLDAVVKATEVLEGSGLLNAGLGSVVDLRGEISMDAGVMWGPTRRAGAVAGVKYPKNPVVLARKVMEETDHVILGGDEADLLAQKLGMPEHPGPSERIMRRYREIIAQHPREVRYKRSLELATRLGFLDTVGAVAVDNDGNTAAAVSTGGVMMKFPGRVGDSAVPGAGFYASPKGAAVATGIGETIIISLLTFRVVEYIEAGYLPSTAAKLGIMMHTALQGENTAGVIAVDNKFNYGANYNTSAMPWGAINMADGRIRIYGFPK
ncbi:MAG: asparaginase [Thermoprotei archaeon]|nr:MAG: asparaginase [Thermoprotei archaeon]